MAAKIIIGTLIAFCGAAGAEVDVAAVFGSGLSVRDMMQNYFELGLSGWYKQRYFYDRLYFSYQKEFGIFEEYAVEHVYAYRLGNTAGFVFYRGRPKLYAGFNVEYYDWREPSHPAFRGATDFWLPAFGVRADWRSFELVAENLGPYGYGFKLGHGMWDNIISAKAFLRPTRHFAAYVTFSYERDAHKVRVIEYRGNQRFEREDVESDGGWFLAAGPAFSF